MLTQDGTLDYLFPILPATTPLATVNVKPPPVGLTVQVGLQGGGRPDPAGRNVDLEVKLFNPGANVLEDTPLLACTVPASKKGDVAQSEPCDITGLSLPGPYDISVKSNHTLMSH